MNYSSIFGIDLAKTNFHIVELDAATGKKIKQHKLKRDQVLDFFKEKTGALVAMEACGTSHYWAQELAKIGCEPRLYKPYDVKAYASTRQKNDTNDALSIAKTAMDLDRKTVMIKTKEQQELTFLHNRRKNVIGQRVETSNSLQAALGEFGVYVTRTSYSFWRSHV